MRHKTLVMASGVLVAVGFVFVSGLMAQETQEPSVADAARRAREQKSNTAKPAKIITDDTLAPGGTTNTTSGVSTVGTASSANGDTSASGASQAAPSGGEPANTGTAISGQEATKDAPKEAEKDSRVVALKEELAKLQNEVDLANRELSLENDSYYSKPDYIHDKDGKAKLDGLADGVKVKQEDLDKLKAKLMEALASSGSAPKP